VLESFDDEGKPILRPATAHVTLRNLLNHTSGYVFFICSPFHKTHPCDLIG
jgi:CubicO group peptidase (beta-lactamase class C family)